MFNRAISLFALLAGTALSTFVGSAPVRMASFAETLMLPLRDAPRRGKRRRRHATRCGQRGSRRAHYLRCAPLNTLTHHSDGRAKECYRAWLEGGS
jgi:hypothetical protein